VTSAAVGQLPGCAAVSLAAGDPLLGSASAIRAWLLVEHPGPWPVDVRERELLDRLPPASAAAVDRLWDEAWLRPLLVRRRGDHRREVATRTVLVGNAVGEQPWLERLVVTDLAELADLDLERVARGPAGIGEPVAGTTWLVCAHGKQDLCCAVNGRPVTDALAADGRDVWEVTHIGGDRYAGNALALPHALMYGRLTPDTALAAAAALDRGEIALEGPAQVAEGLARAHLDHRHADGLHVEAVDEVAAERWAAVVACADGRRVHVAVEAVAATGGALPSRCAPLEPWGYRGSVVVTSPGLTA
jgi:hypothetical protein